MGQLDSPLSPRGEIQAAAIADRLSAIRFQQLYSSDLGRAVQTAKRIGQRCGIEAVLEPGLRERHMGVFQGITREEKKARYPEIWKQCKSVGANYEIPGGGESINQRLERSLEALNRIADAHPDETVVVVSHVGILRGFLSQILGLGSAAEARFVRANASYNAFLKQEGNWRLQVWGDTSHLQGLGIGTLHDPELREQKLGS